MIYDLIIIGAGPAGLSAAGDITGTLKRIPQAIGEGHFNCDGVSFTCDGTEWYLLHDLSGVNEDWETYSQEINAKQMCEAVDENFAIKEAVAVRKGKIVFVGANREVEKYIYPNTTVLDCEGKCILPGLVDAHAHLH